MKRLLAFAALCSIGTAISCRTVQPRLIAVIPRTTGTLLWEGEHEGAITTAHANGYEIYWNGPPAEDDIQRQIELVDMAVQRRPAGIVLAPDHSLALVSAVQRALSASIPVVIVGSPLLLRTQPGLSFVLNDEEAAGELISSYLGKALHGHGGVVILGIDPNIAGLMERIGSFERHMKRDWPLITILKEEPGFFRPAQARQAAREAIKNNQGLNAIFALTAVATQATVVELRSVHRSDVTVVGCDQDIATSLRLDGIDALLIENTKQMGSMAIRSIVLRGKDATTSPTARVPPALLTHENRNFPAIRDILD